MLDTTSRTRAVLAAFAALVLQFPGVACAGDSPGVASPALAVRRTVLCTGPQTRIVRWEPGQTVGTAVWTCIEPTREGWLLPEGRVLLALSVSQRRPKGGAVEIDTRDGDKTVWSYEGTQAEVHCIQRTPEGTYVLVEGGRRPRLLELDAAGRTVTEIALRCETTDAHMQTRLARKQADGTFLVPHLGDFAIKRYGRDGAVLATISTAISDESGKRLTSWPFTAIALPDGSILAGLTRSQHVAEFGPGGERTWALSNADVGGIIRDACGVQRLPNGNTLVNSYGARDDQPRIFEVTRDKRVVWTCVPPDKGVVHAMHVVDGDAAGEATALR